MTYITDDNPIPSIPPIEEAPPVRTEEELHQRWRALMGPGGFSRHSLWVIWFGHDHRQLPMIVPIDDLPGELTSADIGQLATMMQSAVADADAGSVALLLSRPGPSAISDQDKARANTLLHTLGQLTARGAFTLRLWPIHLATSDSVRQLTVDDLA